MFCSGVSCSVRFGIGAREAHERYESNYNEGRPQQKCKRYLVDVTSRGLNLFVYMLHDLDNSFS